jgi:lipoyl(octanoyl) transferase
MEWKITDTLVPYDEAIAFMEERVDYILAHKADEMVWLLEHPPLYTAGTSANAADLLEARFPVYQSGRGGQYTYHGPGQRIAYVMLDLRKRGQDLRRYVQQLEEWIILTLKEFGIAGEVRDGRVGVWVKTPQEAKIAALGVRVRKWVAYHGIAINVSPDLSHFTGIIPCGVRQFGITSFAALNNKTTLQEVDEVLKQTFEGVFPSH